jgi:hypothetical protein
MNNKYLQENLIGEIKPEDMKRLNIPWPDKFGDNVEINRYIMKVFKVEANTYEIEYIDDNTSIRIYKKV